MSNHKNKIPHILNADPWSSKRLYEWLDSSKKIISKKQSFLKEELPFIFKALSQLTSQIQQNIIKMSNLLKIISQLSKDLSDLAKKAFIKLINKVSPHNIISKKEKQRIIGMDHSRMHDFILSSDFSDRLSLINKKITRFNNKQKILRENRIRENSSKQIKTKDQRLKSSKPKIITHIEHLHEHNNKNGMGWRNYYTSSSTSIWEPRSDYRQFRN